jgi:hypothetical protein
LNPTNEDYTIAAFCEAVTNDLDNRVTWFALMSASSGIGGHRVDGMKFDNNVTAAIRAGEWLDRAVMNHRG